jgi:hypothetical protein
MADRPGLPGERPTRRRGRRRCNPGWLALAWVVAVSTAAPVAVLASSGGMPEAAPIGRAAPAPGESCPDETPAPGTSVAFCEDTGGDISGGGGGTNLGFLLALLGAAVAGGLLALVVAYLVLRRRASVPLAPADPGEWWTCSSCGKTNVIGSPRCYACGTWQA